MHCLFRTFSSVTIRVCPLVFRVHSWVWGSHRQGCPLPEADINAIFLNVTPLVDLCLACRIFSRWLIVAVMHYLQVCSKISGHLQKVQDMGVRFRTKKIMNFTTTRRPAFDVSRITLKSCRRIGVNFFYLTSNKAFSFSAASDHDLDPGIFWRYFCHSGTLCGFWLLDAFWAPCGKNRPAPFPGQMS